MGSLVNSRRLQVVTELVDDAVANGARLITGGHRIGNCGWFYAPTVLADAPLHAMVMHEEPFGPIAPCLPVDSMDEALAIRNSLSTGHAP